jgi:hypothetical protein
LILWRYLVPFVFSYSSMTLWTNMLDIFKSFHTARDYSTTTQSKPSA